MSTVPPGCPVPPARDPGKTTGLVSLTEITASRDPHAYYERLRGQWGPVVPVELEPGIKAWLVIGYQELLEITRQELLYSRSARHWADYQSGLVPPDSGLGPMMFPRDNVIGFDGPEHRRLRAPLDEAMAWLDKAALRRGVEAVCARLIGRFADRGAADLMAEYAQPIPLLALATAFGLDEATGDELLAALAALFGSQADSQAGNRSFEDILAAVRDDRARQPREDLTAFLLNHPHLRTRDEQVQAMVVLISAGQETLALVIAKTAEKMLTDPRFAARVRGGQLGVDDALLEVLWGDPPMTHMPARYALADTELGGRPIARGDVLILGLAAANQDPAIHPPDPSGGLAPAVINSSHLAYSAGPHMCPAKEPAWLITRTAVTWLLEELPDLALAVDPATLAPRTSPWTRSPKVLPVRFTPRRTAPD